MNDRIEKINSPLTSERLDRFVAERDSIEEIISALGKEVAEFRGEPVNSNHSFETFERWRGWKDQPEIGIRAGERHISVTYGQWFYGDHDTHDISFPERYLEQDWHPDEQAMLTAKQIKESEERRAAAERREASERAQLAELQAKYGEAK
jgi:hypothetical protein